MSDPSLSIHLPNQVGNSIPHAVSRSEVEHPHDQPDDSDSLRTCEVPDQKLYLSTPIPGKVPDQKLNLSTPIPEPSSIEAPRRMSLANVTLQPVVADILAAQHNVAMDFLAAHHQKTIELMKGARVGQGISNGTSNPPQGGQPVLFQEIPEDKRCMSTPTLTKHSRFPHPTFSPRSPVSPPSTCRPTPWGSPRNSTASAPDMINVSTLKIPDASGSKRNMQSVSSLMSKRLSLTAEGGKEPANQSFRSQFLRSVQNFRNGRSSMQTKNLLTEAFFERDYIWSELKEAHKIQGGKRCEALHPYSLKRLIWDVIGGLLIVFDVIRLPLRVFDLPDGTFDDTMMWLSLVYWTCDIPRQFLIGIESHGVVEMRFKYIAQNYASSWLVPDMVVVGADWICAVIIGAAGATSRSWRVTKTTRALRLLRLFRLLRIIKVPPMLTATLDMFSSEYVQVAVRFTYMMLSVTLSVHYTACYWYGIANASPWRDDVTTDWVRTHRMENANVGELYMACFHWSLAQSGLSSTNIYPTNALERVVASYAMFMWLIILTGVFGMFNVWMKRIRDANLKQMKQAAMIRKYLNVNGVSTDFTSKLLRTFHVHYKLSQKRIHHEDIPYFKELPSQMKIQLHLEVYIKPIRTHALFNYFSEMYPLELLPMCHCCFSEHHYEATSMVFAPGETASEAFYIVGGTLSYYFEQSTEDDVAVLTEGDWISEHVLWTEWTHRGYLKATTSTEVIGFSGSRLMRVIQDAIANKCDMSCLTEYAGMFLELLEEQVTEVTDIWPGADERESITKRIVASRPTKMQHSLTQKFTTWWKTGSFQESGAVAVCQRHSRASVKDLQWLS